MLQLRPALRIALIYAVFGGLWILFSDRLLALFVANAHLLTRLQTFKGWFYVLVTAGLVYYLVSQHLRRETQLEGSRRLSESRLQAVLDNAPAAIFIKDTRGHYLLANRLLREIIGSSEGSILSKTDQDLFPDEQARQYRAHDIEVLNSEKPMEFEEIMISPGGLRRYLATKFPLFDEERRVYALCGILTDITARHGAETQLKKSEERYRTLAANFPNGMILLFDHDLRYLLVDGTGLQELRMTKQEMEGRTLADLFPPAVREAVEPQYRAALAGEKRVAEVAFGDFLYEVHTLPVYDERGDVVAGMAMTQNISQKKQSEKERLLLENQLFQSQKMEAIGRLAGGVAHDFNNQLTGILGYTEMILQSLRPGDPLRSDIEEIHRAAERAAGLTRQLLTFSRKQIISLQVADLNEIANEAQRMLRRLIGEDIELVFVPAPDLAHVKVDRHQIEQMLVNLAVNARDAMPGGGKLMIETANVELDEKYCRQHPDAVPGRYAMLAVSDTGQGMDENTKARLFEPFFTTKEKGRGTGLGLSTTYGMVRQHQGTIGVYSEKGVGTSFKIYLPSCDEPLAPAPPAPARGEVTGKETILLVEDEQTVRDLAEKILARYGYRILVADGGGSALLQAQRNNEPIDLLLTDVVMPNINGKELYRQLRERRPNLKVLYMSGYTENVIVHSGILEADANFISKPFAIEALVQKVRQVLDH